MLAIQMTTNRIRCIILLKEPNSLEEKMETVYYKSYTSKKTAMQEEYKLKKNII